MFKVSSHREKAEVESGLSGWRVYSITKSPEQKVSLLILGVKLTVLGTI